MRLTNKFELAAKTKQELRGLYAVVFNKIADPVISEKDRRSAMALLSQIRQHLGRQF